MARPKKKGLDYWSCDVDIWDSDAMKILMVKLHSRGVHIIMRLMSDIYRHGYYIRWDYMKSVSFMSGLTPDISLDDVEWAVKNLLDIGFFDTDMYRKFNILTSRNIQKRYFQVVGRRLLDQEDKMFKYDDIDTRECKKKLMYTETPVNVYRNSLMHTETELMYTETPVSADINPSSPQTPYLNKTKLNSPPISPPHDVVGQEVEEDESLKSVNMSKYEEALASLSPEAKERSERLKQALEYLGVEPGIQHRLQAKSHFGMVGDPIWKYISDLKGSDKKMSAIKNKGAYLCTCLGI